VIEALQGAGYKQKALGSLWGTRFFLILMIAVMAAFVVYSANEPLVPPSQSLRSCGMVSWDECGPANSMRAYPPNILMEKDLAFRDYARTLALTVPVSVSNLVGVALAKSSSAAQVTELGVGALVVYYTRSSKGVQSVSASACFGVLYNSVLIFTFDSRQSPSRFFAHGDMTMVEAQVMAVDQSDSEEQKQAEALVEKAQSKARKNNAIFSSAVESAATTGVPKEIGIFAMHFALIFVIFLPMLNTYRAKGAGIPPQRQSLIMWLFVSIVAWLLVGLPYAIIGRHWLTDTIVAVAIGVGAVAWSEISAPLLCFPSVSFCLSKLV